MDRPPRRRPPGVPVPDTIEGIERVREPDPGPDATNLVRRCVALRRKPLSRFTTEDLRIMLGRQIAVPILLPMAVAVLADDPFAEGNYYPGDLLHNVVRLPRRHGTAQGVSAIVLLRYEARRHRQAKTFRPWCTVPPTSFFDEPPIEHHEPARPAALGHVRGS